MTSPVDIITLENFESKMPRWNPSSSNHLYALVDMGSNGIRFSISDLSPPSARLLRCVYQERAAISLFDALNESLSAEDGQNRPLTFPADTIKLVSQTLARFWKIAVDDYGVPPAQVTVFATEAMRRAENAAAMLDAISAETPDLVVHILAPHVETLFGSVGARSSFVDVKGLFLDLGGGSVQMTYMDTHAAKAEDEVNYAVAAAVAGESLPFGAARLIKVLENASAAVQAAEKSKLHGSMGEAFQKLRAKFPSLAATAAAAQETDGSGIDIYLCGGGFRGYGSMLMHKDPIQPYPIPIIGAYTRSGKAFSKTKDMLKANKDFDGKIFGMSKRRRAQFPAIVTVVEALIAAVPRIRSVTFCAGGNREGALMMKLPYAIRESNPLALLVAPIAPPLASAHGEQTTQMQLVLDTLISALPDDAPSSSTATVFGQQLGPLFARHIWARTGQDADLNASAALHDAVTGYFGYPGLTHFGRAILGLTLCARWGAGLGPIDQQLHRNLRELVDRTDSNAEFWADYVGAVAAALARVVTAWPVSPDAIKNTIRFRTSTKCGKKYKISLAISISERAARGINLQDLVDIFKNVGKRADDKALTVITETFTA